MIERSLFLPENLMTILYEEQKLFQSLCTFPFRKTIPFFITSKEFSHIMVLPPIQKNDYIIRPCVDPIKDYKNESDGFILGKVKDKAFLIDKIEKLKLKTTLPVFTKIECHSWYYADIEYTDNNKTELSYCRIYNKKWHKGV